MIARRPIAASGPRAIVLPMNEKSPRRSGAGRSSARKSASPATVSDDVLAAAPLVLVLGKEEFLAERAIERVVSLARAADPSTQRRTVSAVSETAAQELSDALAPTLFDDGMVLAITDLDSADDRVVAVISAALATPSDTRRLVAWHPGGVKGRSVLEKMRSLAAVVVPCEPMKGRQLSDFATAEFARHARSATQGAIAAMVIAIGDDPRGLAAAVAQLTSDMVDDPIDESAVLAFYDGVADVKGWDLSDQLWSIQPDEVFTSLRQAEQIKPGSGPAYTAALGMGLRNMVRLSGSPRGAPDADVAREVGIPPFKVRIVRAQLDRWHPAQLARAVRRIAEADHQVKGRSETGEGVEPALQEYALESAIVKILASRQTD